MERAEMSGVNDARSLAQYLDNVSLIDNVKECIEKCMQLYMSKSETAKFLETHKNIKPSITKIVWMRLAEDNREFFRAYNVRLAVQEQIIEFNRLLSAQAELTRQRELSAVNPYQFDSNPSFTTQQIPTTNVVQRSMNPAPDNMNQVFAFNNYGSLMQASTQRAFDQTIAPNMFSPPSSNFASEFNFGRPNNFVGLNPPMNDASTSLIGGNGNNAQPVDDYLASLAFLESEQQASAPGYPVDSTNSSGFSLSSNGQYLDNLISNFGTWEQHAPISVHEYSLDSSGSTGNMQVLDPRSTTGSWTNHFFGQ